MLSLHRWLPPCLLVLVLVWPAQAAVVDKYLPNDTDAVVIINVQQILASPLVKTHYQKLLQDWLKTEGDLQKRLQDLGIDPLKDIDQVIFTNGESLYRLTKRTEQGKVIYGSEGGYFFLIKGRFNAAKLSTAADKLAQDKQGVVAKSTKGLYEVGVGRTLHVGIIDGTTIAVSSRPEPIIDTLERAAGKRKSALQYKEMGTVIGKLDAKKSVGIAIIGSAGFGLDAAVSKVGGKVVEKPIKQMISEDGIDGVHGSINVTDGMAGNVVVNVRGSAVAKDVAKSLQQDLNDTTVLAFNLFVNYPKLSPLAELVKSIKIAVRDAKTVTLEAGVTAKQVEDALK